MSRPQSIVNQDPDLQHVLCLLQLQERFRHDRLTYESLGFANRLVQQAVDEAVGADDYANFKAYAAAFDRKRRLVIGKMRRHSTPIPSP